MAKVNDIKYIIDNKDNIKNLIELSSKGKSNLIWNPSAQLSVDISGLESVYSRFNNENDLQKKKELYKTMQDVYNKIDKNMKKIQPDINKQVKGFKDIAVQYGDDTLNDDIVKYNKLYNDYYNRSNPTQQGNIVDILPGDNEATKKEEVKQVATPVVDTTKQVPETTTPVTTVPVDTKPDEYYQGRKLVYDEKDPKKLIGFISKKTGETVKIGDKLIGDTVLTQDNLKNEINKGIAGYQGDTIKMLEKEKIKTDDKDKIKEIDSGISDIKKELIKRGINENQMKEMGIQ